MFGGLGERRLDKKINQLGMGEVTCDCLPRVGEGKTGETENVARRVGLTLTVVV